MKIIKHLFPRLTGSLRSCPKQSPPLRKKALLVGIRKIREDSAEIPQENGERPPEDDVHIAPRRKKKKMKARKERDEEGTRELKGPHRDVLDMKQLLIGALYQCYPFSYCLLSVFLTLSRCLPLRPQGYHCPH